MENLTVIILLASAVLGIILLVSWFNTAKNVKLIKEKLFEVNSLSLIEQGRMAEFMNDKPMALSYYLKAIYEDAKDLYYMDDYTREHTEKSLKKQYLHLIERNGGKWPDFKILSNPD